MLISLLGKLTPDHMRLVLIDPKRLEFAGFADIPHLLFPIVTQPTQAVKVLQWLVRHMEERYEKMAAVSAKNIRDYNALQADMMPSIVVFIDELADLMMTAGKQVEDSLARLAQMARAAGIHLIVATQRPSVDVITGLIKVNFPSRIAFRVTSKVDSRTILDECGAEKLLGKGDMLFMDATGMRRVHGCYLSDDALKTIINVCKKQGVPSYISFESSSVVSDTICDENDAELYKQVESFVMTLEEVSISLVQRKFRIGFNRSARIVELLEERGRISSSDGARMKKVLRSVQVEK
jgi:S-DNA-T family DNA segregation ATPase FtsK/SpoIIIE